MRHGNTQLSAPDRRRQNAVSELLVAHVVDVDAGLRFKQPDDNIDAARP